ncbi:uncharacterized protein LOC106159895 [Lingula anatina]|uniref:Uncharacterized protein LOC106159895 n=1 Tax=Lingula anatina TaxID=7574 RepID=A0A1S3I0L0_LINAN|nr:uncharacterized protein LOC106159895 [Lingula anatina]|eukprot:XP_013391797.1 uncharacterized protein LOC106159895 [Lingula anatina]
MLTQVRRLQVLRRNVQVTPSHTNGGASERNKATVPQENPIRIVPGDPKHRLASVEVNGLGLDDYDRTGNLSVWKIAKWFEGTRKFSFDDIHVLPELNKTSLAYIIATKYVLTPDVYIPYRQALQCRLRFDTWMYKIGGSTYVISTQCFRKCPTVSGSCDKDVATGQNIDTDDTTDCLVGECIATMVAVDKVTHKAVSLPNWFRENFGSHVVPSPLPLSPVSPLTPSSSVQIFTSNFHVPPSDMDHNWHTHHTKYIRYCIDEGTKAAHQGAYRQFQDDLCHSQVCYMEMLYTGQSQAGDVLQCSSWEVENADKTLCFQVNKDSVPLFHCSMKFR